MCVCECVFGTMIIFRHQSTTPKNAPKTTNCFSVYQTKLYNPSILNQKYDYERALGTSRLWATIPQAIHDHVQ